MAKALEPANYEILSISKDGGGEISLEGKTTSFDYYESILSPNITATMTFVDTGGSVGYPQEYDRQERVGSIYNALPITGGEKVKFKIKHPLGTLDFSTDEKALLVNSALNPDQESQRETVILSLFSQIAKTNQESKVYEKGSGKISDTVGELIKRHLKVDNVTINATANNYSFIGNSLNVFDVILWLASKSVPGEGNPGYFFYETQDGINFRGIDDLISQGTSSEYNKSAVLRSNLDNDDNDYKMISSKISKNQNLINSLKAGVYKLRGIFWDPFTFKYTESVNSFGKNMDLVKSLGKSAEAPEVEEFTRTHYDILDVGTLTPSGKGADSTEDSVQNDPRDWQLGSTMRYNVLFSQVLNIQVPCNPNLKAGDTIKCNFEIITQGEKEQGSSDPVQSGSYLIADLCHHFDPSRSITSMTLVRDSYGLYTNKNKS